jgi:environmental stress-induced protein Ves
MPPRVLRLSHYRRMPWKNGRGETIEIAVSPAASGLDDFDWRVSMAPVAADGPFSVFPGIDRTLAVLDGRGIRLAVRGLTAIELTRESVPFSFAADADARATLLDGPITDLNVMTRRGRFRHVARRFCPGTAMDLEVGAAAVLLFCHEGHAAIEADGAVHRLDPGATLLGDREAAVWHVIPEGRPRLLLVEIEVA